MSILPDNVLSKMNPEDRKSMGKAGMTNEEADAKCQAGKERELQKQIANWLRLNGFMFIQSRTDKRTTVCKGVADFIVFAPRGITICCECKTIVGKLSHEQLDWHKRIQGLHHHAYVVCSLPEFISLVKSHTKSDQP